MADTEATGVEDLRRGGRLRCESLRCSLGSIVNLSITGARVRRRFGRKPREGDLAQVRIRSRFGELRVQARVVWVRRQGSFGYEAGLEFLSLNVLARTVLTDIAREHHDRRVFGRAA